MTPEGSARNIGARVGAEGRAMRRLLVLAATLGAAVLVACGGSDEPAPAPTPTASPTTTAAATSTQSVTDIRSLDFTNPALLGPIVDHFGGGEIEPRRIAYTDMTGDGAEEAIVFVESGGTAGDLGACVVTLDGGAHVVLGYVDAGGHVELRFPEAGGGVIVAQEGVYEPGDAQCCPSSLRERTYRWDGDTFAVVSDQVVANPDVE